MRAARPGGVNARIVDWTNQRASDDRELDDSACGRPHDGCISENTWESGVFQRFPWLGLAGLLLMLACMGAACFVAIYSDGKETSAWPVTPAVWLALCSAAANTLAAFSFAEGAAISWWRRALTSSSINELHRQWDSTTGAWPAIKSLFQHPNLAAFACILVAAVAVDGPLLQRASTVTTIHRESPCMLRANLVDRLPTGFTGQGENYSASIDLLTPHFAAVMLDLSRHSAIDVSDWGCKDSCIGSVQGAGLAPICTETTNTSFSVRNSPNPPFGTLFSIDFDWQGTQSEITSYFEYDLFLTMNTFSSQTHQDPEAKGDNAFFGPPCTGISREQSCKLYPAIIEYPFLIVNNSLTLTGDPNRPTVITRQNVTILTSNNAWDYPGVSNALQSRFGTLFKLCQGFPDDVVGVNMTGSTSQNYLQSWPSYDFNTGWGCAFNFSDPATDLLSDVHELMFRAALAAANTNGSFVKTIEAVNSIQVVVFHSHYPYLLGAMALMGICLLAVMGTFYGWWRLGRQPSMSPIEIARTFNAPLLMTDGLPSTLSLERFLKRMGKRQVRFGVPVAESGMGGTLGFGDSKEMSAPIKGVVY